MKLVQANAISLNGLIARENGEEDWLPAEGWTEFVDDAKKYGNFIMGRETYELVMKLYPDHNFDDVDVPYKIIVTSNATFTVPDGYVVVRSPEEAKTFLTERNTKVGLLVGGGKLNSSFYARSLIDEVWITMNPHILGKGRPFISSADFDIKLKLTDIVRLNKDRVQLKYTVAK
jgi:dihydrofolate reductase